jgi:caffeoyl-CoA O-methyltransferase
MTVYNERIKEYITDLFAVEDHALRLAREESLRQGLPAVNVKPEEGRLLQFLVRLCNARRVVEIGTLGGYSGIWIARGLAPGGKLITLERDTFHAQLARQHFSEAGVADRIEVRVGNALELLPALAPEGPFDFVFIDAEKPDNPAYIDWALENVRQGGVIAVHNAFRGGRIVDPSETEETVRVMRKVNEQLAKDSRVISTIYPAGDGTLVAVKIA